MAENICTLLPDDWPEWCSAQKLAQRWGVHRSTIYRMHQEDPENFGRELGGSLRFHRSMIEAKERLEDQKRVTQAVRNARRLAGYRRPPGAVDHFAGLKRERARGR